MTESIGVVAITGASGGIGRALALALSERGASLALMARRDGELAEIAKLCGPNSIALKTDVTSREDVQQAVAAITQRFGRIDVWVNNVGRGITRAPSELSDEDIDEMMLINVKSAWYGIQAVLPQMKARGTGQIVNLSSMLGRVPLSIPRAGYNGAKHFLNAITANLRDELAIDYPGITISLVSPGLVWTDFGANALHGGPLSTDLGNGQIAGEAAEVLAGVITEKRTDVYTRTGSLDKVLTYLAGMGEDP